VGSVQILRYSISTVAPVCSAHPRPNYFSRGWLGEDHVTKVHVSPLKLLFMGRQASRHDQQKQCYWSGLPNPFENQDAGKAPIDTCISQQVIQASRECNCTQPYNKYIEPNPGRRNWPSRTRTAKTSRGRRRCRIVNSKYHRYPSSATDQSVFPFTPRQLAGDRRSYLDKTTER